MAKDKGDKALISTPKKREEKRQKKAKEREAKTKRQQQQQNSNNNNTRSSSSDGSSSGGGTPVFGRQIVFHSAEEDHELPMSVDEINDEYERILDDMGASSEVKEMELAKPASVKYQIVMNYKKLEDVSLVSCGPYMRISISLYIYIYLYILIVFINHKYNIHC